VTASDSGETSSDLAADEFAIRELVRRQQAGWDSGNAQKYADVFTADADYITFLGGHHKGRDAIAASYEPMFRSLLRGSQLHIEIKQLRFLTADVALIYAHAAASKGARGKRRPNRINTTVAVRTSDGWRLAGSQNTTRRKFAEKLLQVLVSRRSS
jgi:uncharacterized protein (TIGR02246 family)